MAITDQQILDKKRELIAETMRQKREEEERKRKEEEERKRREEEERQRKAEEERRQKEEAERLRAEAEKARTEAERKAREEQAKKVEEENQRKAELDRMEREAQNARTEAERKARLEQVRRMRGEEEKPKTEEKKTTKPHLYYDDGNDKASDTREQLSHLRRQKKYEEKWGELYSREDEKKNVVAKKEAGENDFKATDKDNQDYVDKTYNKDSRPDVSGYRANEMSIEALTRDSMNPQEELPRLNADDDDYEMSEEDKLAYGFKTEEDTMPEVDPQKLEQVKTWLNPNVVVGNEAKARQLIKEYEQEELANRNAVLTPEQQEYRDAIKSLKDKISNAEAIALGSMNAVPGVNALINAGDRKAQEAENQIAAEEGRIARDMTADSITNSQQNAFKQNPLAYLGGNIGTGLALNMAGQGILGGTKYGEVLENGVKNIFGDGVVSQVVTDALMDMPVDLALDTLPELANNIASGKDAGEVLKDLGINLGVNAGLNLGASVLGNAGDIKNSIKNGINELNADNAVKNFNKSVNANNSAVFSEMAQEMPGGVPKQIVNEDIVNSQLARDFDELNKVLPEQTSLVNARKGMQNRIAEEALATQNNDMEILRQALANQDINPAMAESIVKNVDNAPINQVDNVVKNADNVDNVIPTLEDTVESAKPTAEEVKDARIRLNSSDRNAVKSIEDDINSGKAFEDGYAQAKAEEITKNYYSGYTGKNPEDIDVSSEWSQQNVRMFKDDVDTLINNSDTNVVDDVAKNTETNIPTFDDGYRPLTNTEVNSYSDYVQQTEEAIPQLTNEVEPTPMPKEKPSKNPYRTANADVDANYVDLDYGTNPKVTFDERGIKEETLADGTTMKRSKTYDNTFLNQVGTTAEEKEALNPENYMYAVSKRADSVELASENVRTNLSGLEKTYLNNSDVKDFSQATAEDADNLFAMQKNYLTRQRLAKEAGDAETVAILQRKVDQATKAIQERATKSAQFLRALCDYSNDADGAILAADSIVSHNYARILKEEPRVAKAADKSIALIKNGIDTYIKDNGTNMSVETAEALLRNAPNKTPKIFRNNVKQLDLTDLATQLSDAVKHNENYDDILEEYKRFGITGYNGISQTTRNQVSDIFDSIKDLNYNSKEYMKKESEAYALLASELNMTGSFADKVNTWRYFAMLANPKTHLRNIMGNTLFGTTTKIKDDVAALLEATFIGKGEGRTKSILNPLSASDNELKRASKENIDEVARLLYDGNKYTSADQGILANIPTWSDKGGGKFMNSLTDLNTKALDLEDKWALNNKYSDSLARYLKANGADASIFNATDEASKDLLKRAQDYAINEAKYATFHNDNVFAEGMSELRNKFKNKNTIGGTIGTLIMDSLVPFAKTPSNIVNAIASYSPLNSVKVLSDLKGIQKGTKTASDLIDDMAKTMTGTALFGTGYWLAQQGIITADKDKEAEEGNLGQQSYSLNLDTIGEKLGKDSISGSYTIDNFAPVGAILLAGASLAQERGDDENVSASILDALTSSFNPIVETSMLQNFADILTQASYADNAVNALTNVASQTATGYATQFVPSELGNLVRGFDNSRYSAYTDKNGVEGTLDRTLKTLSNKTGVNNVLQMLVDSDNEDISKFAEEHKSYKYIDKWGNETENYTGVGKDNMVARMAYQNLSPGYYQQNSATELDVKLNDIGSENKGFPTGKNQTIDRKLTPKEYDVAARTSGELKTEALNECFDSDLFNGFDKEVQKSIADDCMSFANKVALSKAVGSEDMFKSDENEYNVYKKYGIEGYANYKIAKAISKEYADGKSTTAKTDAWGILDSDMSDDMKLDLLKQKDEKLEDMNLKQAEFYYRSLYDIDPDMNDSQKKYEISQRVFDSDMSDDDKLGVLYRTNTDKADKIKSLYDYGGINFVDNWYDYTAEGGTKYLDEDTGTGKIPYLNGLDISDSERGYLLYYGGGTLAKDAIKAYEKGDENDYSAIWNYYYKKYMK